jgi:hypothetical protein
MRTQALLFARLPALHRRGNITVLAAVMSVVLMGLVAFAVDLGYVLASKQELQRTADAAALAACWSYGARLAEGSHACDAINEGRLTAAQYAVNNVVAGAAPAIDSNQSNSTSGDLVFGEITDLYDPNFQLSTTAMNRFNAVRIRVRRDTDLNGEVPFFFAKVFGRTGQGLAAEATAGYVRNVAGFQTPGDGSNLNILPYALDEDTWNDLLNGLASDNYSWNAETQQISSGGDGIREVNLFPQGTGSPGNRGTVDIGSSNNSTNDIARQILHGVSPADMAYHNGELKFDANGELELNGDTGISAGVKDELASIRGEPRVIPIFRVVNGPGNNAQYTIVHWAGIRIMAVKLTGSMNSKHVTIQPCPLVTKGVIPSTTETSDYVYSPVVLVR